MTAYEDDLGKAGTLSLPITLIVLVLTFGSLVAAGIPLLLALTAVFATFGLVALSSVLLPVAMQAPAMVLLIGLAVGVDYSMFYLKRERQERAAGRSPQAALEIAAATSGRSVLISGLTVMVAMAGMFLTGDSTFASLALATILVVAVAVLGSLTVLPALLSRLGDKVDRGRVPLVGRLRRDDGEGRIWGAIVDRVLRRPALSAILAASVLVALAAPALQLRLAAQGPESFPKGLEVIATYDRMQQAFPGSALPASVVVEAPSVRTPAVQRAIAELERRALASGRAFEPITVDINRAGTVANITVPIAGNGTDAASNASFRMLRNEVVPETVGALPDAQAGVTGQTAKWRDEADALRSNLPPVVAFVLLFAFGLMLVAFRSIVVAIKAIVLNLLSVAAAYGVLVIVFQHGVGKGLLGVRLRSRDRRRRAAAPVRDPVRPLDGLPRVHPEPDPRDVRPRQEHGRGGLVRDQVHRRSRHERGDRHGRRLRGLRDAVVALLQAVRRRARGGDPDRRNDRQGRTAARLDEAARRLELVPADGGSNGCLGSSTTRQTPRRNSTSAPVSA